MATIAVRNGVDVDRLVQTIAAIQDDPGAARFTFKARTEWRGGSTSRTEISSFTHAGREVAHVRVHELTGCEPEVLLGADRGPNAVELVLAALGSCYAVGFIYNAAARGYEIEELRYDVEGDLDLRSFVGIAEGPRPGFTAIRVRGEVKARNARPDELEELCRYVQDTSPVLDIIANRVPVETSITVR